MLETTRGADFTKLLGDDAYVYWNPSELQKIFLRNRGLNSVEVHEFGEFEKNAFLVIAY